METIGRRRIKGAVDVKMRCLKDLRKAWHNSLKHHVSIVIGIVSGFSNRGLQCGESSLLFEGQFDSCVIPAQHISCLRPTCNTLL